MRLLRARSPALVVATATVLLAGCGGSGTVSLARLAQRQQAYAGKQVRTQGLVQEEHDPDGTAYYVLSDQAGDLVGLKPLSRARRYTGSRVLVSGRFRVQPGFGRVLWIATIRSR